MQQAKDNPIQGQPKDVIEVKPGAAKGPEAAQPIQAPPLDPGKPFAELPPAKLEPGQFPGQVPVAKGKVEPKAKGDVGDFVGPALWLIGALLLLALVFWAVGRWRRREEKRDDVSEQLTRFRESYEQGEMSEDEYKRVHALLAGKMQDKGRPAPKVAEKNARQSSPNGPDGPSK